MIALFAIALLILGAAAGAMALRNLIHSALLLIGSWAGIAAFYLWAGAEFVAFAQILIYVGAISMVVLFAVLLTRQADPMPPVAFDSLRRVVSGLIVGGGVAGVLLGAILGTPLDGSAAAKAPVLTVRDLGTQLMGPHTAALLIVGLLLTVALLGAVVLASVDRPDGREDAP